MTAESALDGLRTASAIPWAYRFFELTPPYPFGVLLDDSAKSLAADNKAYFSVFKARLELYDAAPNENIESLIENWLDANALTWRKEPRENASVDGDTVPLFMTAYEMEAI